MRRRRIPHSPRASFSSAQPAPSTAGPASDAPSVLHPATRASADDANAALGAYFDSETAAITFRQPLNMNREPHIIGGPNADVVATFLDPVGKRKLTLTQMRFSQDVPLTTPKEGVQSSVLEQRTDALKETAGAEVLKSDVFSVGFKSAPTTRRTRA